MSMVRSENFPVFRVSNVVLAETIRARCRSQAWMMSKALNLSQVMTDSGVYSPGEVFHLRKNGKPPGFDKLADIRERLPAHKSIYVGGLQGLDWKEVFQSPDRDALLRNWTNMRLRISMHSGRTIV